MSLFLRSGPIRIESRPASGLCEGCAAESIRSIRISLPILGHDVDWFIVCERHYRELKEIVRLAPQGVRIFEATAPEVS